LKTILVTGVGAIIGYGILQSIKKIKKRYNLIGIDINSNAAGQIWTNQFFISPPVSNKNYLNWIKKIILKNKIDLVIPGIEQDISFFSKNVNKFKKSKCKIVLNSNYLVRITNDKFLFDKVIKKINPQIRIKTSINTSFKSLREKLGCPFLVKPRKSYASKGIHLIKSERDFKPFAKKLRNIYLAQEIVGSDNEEYTIGTFGDGKGNLLASIALKRRLSPDGSTKDATVIKDKNLNILLHDLYKKLKPLGPTNFQFRKTLSGWKILEINPRISSSCSIRSSFGYNEAEMSIKFYLEKKLFSQPKIKSGYAIRYICDKIYYDRNHF
jgi:carbamoyl-phosphate synthase large subunit